MNNLKSDSAILNTIYLASALVLAFLFWFIYGKEAASSNEAFISYLPYVNASLNFLTTILLILGYAFIKQDRKEAHIKTMFLAVATSALFLISYLIYHHYHGDTKFVAEGPVRPIYFFILISHILLSVAMLPMILGTLFFASQKNWDRHRKWAKKTFPVWLYVSITGVLIFIFLQFFNS